MSRQLGNAIEKLKQRIILDRLAGKEPQWYGSLESVAGYLTPADYEDIQRKVTEARRILE